MVRMRKCFENFYWFFSVLGWFWLTFFVYMAIFNNGIVNLKFNILNEMILEFFVFLTILLFLLLYPLKKDVKSETELSSSKVLD